MRRLHSITAIFSEVTMFRIIPAMLLTICILSACDDDAVSPGGNQIPSSDQYDVYSALIDSLYIYESTNLVVIRDTTDSYDLSHPDVISHMKQALGVRR